MNAAALRTEIKNSLSQRFGIDLTIRDKAAPEILPTGVPGIDIPRGTLTEVSGPASSGRTSILHAVLARATRQPEFCALIDAGNSFDPLSATNAGVYLPHLLWLRCTTAEKALKAADLVIQAGGFGVVALDLAGVPSRDARRISLASWFRLRHTVENTPTALIVIGDERYTGSCSTLQIENRATGFDVSDHLLRALTVDAAIGPRNRTKSAFALKPLYRK
jgi:recombination protein RecA